MDSFSQVAVPIILALFPDWEPLAKVSPRPDGAGSAVEFNIPCPSPAAEYGLWVSTADEELSVGFHTHHNHFTDYKNPLNLSEIEAGVQHAADILDERVGVVSWYRGQAFACSRTISLPYPDPLPGLFDDMGPTTPEVARIFSDCDRVTLRSWLGRFDREELRS